MRRLFLFPISTVSCIAAFETSAEFCPERIELPEVILEEVNTDAISNFGTNRLLTVLGSIDEDPIKHGEELFPDAKTNAIRGDQYQKSERKVFSFTQAPVKVLNGLRQTLPVESAFDFSFYTEDYKNPLIVSRADSYSDVSSELDMTVSQSYRDWVGSVTLNIPLSERDTRVSVDEAWLQLSESIGSHTKSITLGTQYIYDQRGWFYDSTLDMLSFSFQSGNSQLYFGAGYDTPYRYIDALFEAEGEDLLRWFFNYQKQYRNTHNFALISTGLVDGGFDEGNGEANIKWLGGRASGSLSSIFSQQFDYWAQLGFIYGQESISFAEEAPSTRKVRGYGYDFGFTYLTKFPGNLLFTAALAGTSGDSNPNNDLDNGYRQTGIHSNSADIGNAESTSYYGLAVAPELSNLRIASLAVDFMPHPHTQVSVLYHDYRQQSLNNEVRNFSLEFSHNGRSRKIGRALDLTLTYLKYVHWSATISLGFFEPGNAIDKPHNLVKYSLASFNLVF